MKPSRPQEAGLPRSNTGVQKALRRALLLALATPFAIPVACAIQSESTSATGTGGSTGTSTSSGTATAGAAGAGGDTVTDGGMDANPCDPYEYPPDVADKCSVYVRAPCGLAPDVVPSLNCYLTPVDCLPFCGQLAFNCRTIDDSCVDGSVVNDSDGGVTIDCATCVGGLGRVPAGLRRARAANCQSVLGAHFAGAAHLEAASVHAFRRLGAELTAHGAPEALVSAARLAERDEVLHARRTARLARRFGAATPRARVKTLETRPLDVIALENAVEGCVRETFGAAVAAFQAERAVDPEIASLMATIAEDEARHASLSWSVARWANRRLPRSTRAHLAARCRAAMDQLRREIQAPVHPDLAIFAGVPTPAQQAALLTSLEQHLWPALQVRRDRTPS